MDFIFELLDDLFNNSENDYLKDQAPAQLTVLNDNSVVLSVNSSDDDVESGDDNFFGILEFH